MYFRVMALVPGPWHCRSLVPSYFGAGWCNFGALAFNLDLHVVLVRLPYWSIAKRVGPTRLSDRTLSKNIRNTNNPCLHRAVELVSSLSSSNGDNEITRKFKSSIPGPTLEDHLL